MQRAFLQAASCTGKNLVESILEMASARVEGCKMFDGVHVLGVPDMLWL